LILQKEIESKQIHICFIDFLKETWLKVNLSELDIGEDISVQLQAGNTKSPEKFSLLTHERFISEDLLMMELDQVCHNHFSQSLLNQKVS